MARRTRPGSRPPRSRPQPGRRSPCLLLGLLHGLDLGLHGHVAKGRADGFGRASADGAWAGPDGLFAQAGGEQASRSSWAEPARARPRPGPARVGRGLELAQDGREVLVHLGGYGSRAASSAAGAVMAAWASSSPARRLSRVLVGRGRGFLRGRSAAWPGCSASMSRYGVRGRGGRSRGGGARRLVQVGEKVVQLVEFGGRGPPGRRALWGIELDGLDLRGGGRTRGAVEKARQLVLEAVARALGRDVRTFLDDVGQLDDLFQSSWIGRWGRAHGILGARRGREPGRVLTAPAISTKATTGGWQSLQAFGPVGLPPSSWPCGNPDSCARLHVVEGIV
jgi:hypothetical protein